MTYICGLHFHYGRSPLNTIEVPVLYRYVQYRYLMYDKNDIFKYIPVLWIRICIGSVLDPYSGAFWIRIRIRNTRYGSGSKHAKKV